MTKIRRERDDNQYPTSRYSGRPLRIVASGTLFMTHTLSVPCHPAPSTVIRAHSVDKTRGGSANMVLSVLAQFPAVESVLVASLGGNEEGRMILRDLENEGVITQYCKIWRDAGVPSAWVLNSAEDNTRMIVNHNPLPDITHEDFISLLGPLLAPENYPQTTPTISPTIPTYGSSSNLPASSSTPRPSQSGPRPPTNPILYNPHSPAPFDWIHFEGRSVKTTLSNITGLDGLARERKWRSHCVFSVDIGRKGRQGVEALIPHADVLFFNKQYAQQNSPQYETTPRIFLLSLATIAPPHALLVAYWGKEGGAVLSLPTKEYFQSSGWVEDRPPPPPRNANETHLNATFNGMPTEVQSVRSGSEFWADGRSRTPSSQAFTTNGSHYMSDMGHGSERSNLYQQARSHTRQGQGTNQSTQYTATEDDDNDSQATETPGGRDADDGLVDEVGAQDAFIAGMVYALSRRLCPGLPYTPAWTGEDDSSSSDDGRGRWRLDECLRFATELSGRKARRAAWAGLADEVTLAGWFDS
ncbi:unnamed protein product [Cyclocybe aegerita]|uniref:Carbohydrate kinase PfkB domain-containing protein n=1 Tax=Cyclocybe aegerita TaxID=1973307 RepID=A0A8S0WVS8_CYCAE|nr:unnamed protein product [Cyclocybe aegerita]